ncbi:MAG: hypothetical protein ACE5D3_02820 [Candidatus Binatia bacterium]
MISLAALIIVVSVAAVIARPFMLDVDPDIEAVSVLPAERWEREKSIAITAIHEAEFDQATGKLTEADYLTLRSVYEDRAINAMRELDLLSDGPARETSSAPARFCRNCGREFHEGDRFCAGCGRER